ncbi:MAG: FmdB family zinc ribbon protein [Armatimonadota bacterium]
MPVYEYRCERCSCRFEQYRELEERATCKCPKCGKQARKVFRPVGIVFKGSGFHVTDYPSSGRPGPAGGKGRPGEESPKTEPAGVGRDKEAKKD